MPWGPWNFVLEVLKVQWSSGSLFCVTAGQGLPGGAGPLQVLTSPTELGQKKGPGDQAECVSPGGELRSPRDPGLPWLALQGLTAPQRFHLSTSSRASAILTSLPRCLAFLSVSPVLGTGVDAGAWGGTGILSCGHR